MEFFHRRSPETIELVLNFSSLKIRRIKVDKKERKRKIKFVSNSQEILAKILNKTSAMKASFRLFNNITFYHGWYVATKSNGMKEFFSLWNENYFLFFFLFLFPWENCCWDFWSIFVEVRGCWQWSLGGFEGYVWMECSVSEISRYKN